jgi:hypothetical protein
MLVKSDFPSGTLAVLQRVYEEACREAGVEENASEPPWRRDRRARIAATIMHFAVAGELNPRVLKSHALSQQTLAR